MTGPRVLPPDVFDALEFSALAFGGIGAGQWFDRPKDPNAGPHCYVGHLAFTGAIKSEWVHSPFGISEEQNDMAVAGTAWAEACDAKRLPFAEWCKRLNVVRGDEPTFDPANFPPRSQKKRRNTPPSPVSRSTRRKGAGR